MNNQANIRDEIDLLELLKPLLPRWKLLLLVFILAGAASYFISNSLPKEYASKASIFVQRTPGVSNLLSGLPSSITGGGANINGYLITLLQSQSMLTSLIEELNLQDNQLIFPKGRPMLTEALTKMGEIISVTESKNGAVVISARTKSPDLAADIVNKMLDLLSTFFVTASGKKADFTFTKLQETQKKLDQAEEKLLKFLESNDVASLDEQTTQMIKSLAMLDEQLISVEAELKQVTSRLENSGDVESLIDLEVKKRALTSSRDYIQSQRTDIRKKLANLPEVAAKYSKLQREIMILSKSFELLTEQYELAEITQKGEDGDYQIIDHAIPNPKKVAPRNGVNALLGSMLGFVIASIIIIAVANRPKAK